MFLLEGISNALVALKYFQRILILIIVDSFLILNSILIILWQSNLSFGDTSFYPNRYIILSLSLSFGILFYYFTGQYRSLTRYLTSKVVYSIALRNFGFLVFLNVFYKLLNLPEFPLTIWFDFWLLLTLLTSSVRVIFRDILYKFYKLSKKQKRVIVYGAGEEGAKLAASFRIDKLHKIIAFIDDSTDLNNRNVNGIPIYRINQIHTLISKIDLVLIANPSLTRKGLKLIINEINNVPNKNIPILKIPSIKELDSGLNINKLRPISIDELLGRNSVHTKPYFILPQIKDKVICVIGAGGSIGSELCRQILKLNPLLLILLDISESSLFLIEQDILAKYGNKVNILSVLGDSSNEMFLTNLFDLHNVDFVFHAAAYKHVPLVEMNPLVGISNNVLSSLAVCQASKRSSVKKSILISTDKAVRPTNVMGASKRLSEIIFQAFAEKELIDNDSTSIEASKLNKISFSMVRFGNVLGSSGSVVPTFTKQLESGGPITLTHPKIVRYFMTIFEASLLVLEAAALAEGGEVFLLDMGKPISILKLAKQMINLSGLKVKDGNNPDGDIEIIYTGLRPGEKLFEELLIDAKSLPTLHPLIFRAMEKSFPYQTLWPKIDELKAALLNFEEESVLQILQELVPEWDRKY